MVEWRESDFVDDEEIVSAELFDGFADGVVGGCPVEVLDEIDCGEVSDFVSGGHRGAAEGDEVVRFAGAGGSDHAQVRGGPDPVERDEVVV